MPRYYFHARSLDHCIPDHEGVELDDVVTARAAALFAAVDALDDMDDLKHQLDWTFEITDEAGQTILTIPFSECALAWGLRRTAPCAPRRKHVPLRNHRMLN